MEKKRMNFLDLLVKDVPYSYNFKKPRFAKKPIEHLGYEVDDSHRFRNSVYIFEAPGKCDEKPKKKTSLISNLLFNILLLRYILLI